MKATINDLVRQGRTSLIKRLDSNVGASHGLEINPFLVSSEDQTITKYKPRIWGSINTTEDFMYTIEVLEIAKEDDIVELHISSNGGDVYATETLIHAMQKCRAHIHIIMTGCCASCGTLPMFYADSWETGEFASFMFHDFSVGTPVQTMSASRAMTDFEYRHSEEMLRAIYRGFFTEDEFAEIFSGKQWYMSAAEVSERFQRRLEMLEQEEGDDEDDPTKKDSPCSCGKACKQSNLNITED